MNYLSLFSGVGGGDLAFQHLLDGFRCVGYVEYEEYCQKVLKQRIKDGLLDAAPIFGDIRKFISEGYAESYKGMVYLITGGFPCQRFSTAKHGVVTARNLWPWMFKVISTIKPNSVFVENVNKTPIRKASSDLHLLGYYSKASKISAKDLGADHIRERYWLCSYTDNKGELFISIDAKMERVSSIQENIWQSNPNKSGISNGVAYRVDRFKAIGNGQVPQVAATAWEILSQYYMEPISDRERAS